MTCTCPTCGQEVNINGERFLWNHLSGWLFTRDRAVKLSPRRADILEVLLSSQPSPVTTKGLVRAVYGARGGKDLSPSIIHVQVHATNKILRGTGIQIANAGPAGYYVEFSEAASRIAGGE